MFTRAVLLIWTALAACTSDGAARPADADANADLDTADGAEAEEAAAFPACGSGVYAGRYLLPGPAEPGWDAVLDAKARRIDRMFAAVHAWTTGVNQDVTINTGDPTVRDLFTRFATESDAWDFASFAGRPINDALRSREKVAGLYAGVGIAADALRYMVLRDQGAPCADVDRARALLVKSITGLQRALRIAGTPGVVVRGYQKIDDPGTPPTPVPLRDGTGAPLPAEKNNGTWRAAGDPADAGWLYEDSCSRDMMLGWAAAVDALFEAARGDDSLPAAALADIRARAKPVVEAWFATAASGYDLEFPDSDGRTTFHGYMNEQNFDRAYIPGIENGFHTIMALGVVPSFLAAAGDDALERRFYDEYVIRRDFGRISAEKMTLVALGDRTNFSNVNMAIGGAGLALRRLTDPAARERVTETLERQIYKKPRASFMAAETKQSLFDFIYASSKSPPDAEATARGLETLRAYADAPYWDTARVNCDEAEIAAGSCTLDDGTTVKVLGGAGRNGDLIVDKPVPMAVRPPSNYHWRSNPYMPNGGGDGSRLLPAVDFRYAYWLGRATRIDPP